MIARLSRVTGASLELEIPNVATLLPKNRLRRIVPS